MINQTISKFADFLTVEFGLSREPYLYEVRTIVRELLSIPEENRTREKWKQVISKHFSPDNPNLLEGLDMSDLNLLHKQIVALVPSIAGGK